MTITVTRDRTRQDDRTSSQVRGHRVTVDELPAVGGEDTGPDAARSLRRRARRRARRSRCVWYANRKAIPLEDVTVTVERDDTRRAPGHVSPAHHAYGSPARSPTRSATELLNVAGKCPGASTDDPGHHRSHAPSWRTTSDAGAGALAPRATRTWAAASPSAACCRRFRGRRRPVRVLRSHGAGRSPTGGQSRRAPASAHRPCHRHLSVRRRDRASRQPGRGPAHRARRRQLDDRRPRHRALGAPSARSRRPRATRCMDCSCGRRCRAPARKSRPASRTRRPRTFPLAGGRPVAAAPDRRMRSDAGRRSPRSCPRSISTWPRPPGAALTLPGERSSERAVYSVDAPLARRRHRRARRSRWRCSSTTRRPPSSAPARRALRRDRRRDARRSALPVLEFRVVEPRAHRAGEGGLDRATHGADPRRDGVDSAAVAAPHPGPRRLRDR